MTNLFFICSIVFGLFWLGAIVIWIIWIRPYMERYGKKSGFLLNQSALFRDYRAAIDLARQQGGKPWFPKAFSVFVVIAVSFFMCGLLATIINEVSGW